MVLLLDVYFHALKLNVDTPAQIAMDNYCNSNNEQKFRGRTQTILPYILFREFHVYRSPLVIFKFITCSCCVYIHCTQGRKIFAVNLILITLKFNGIVHTSILKLKYT